MCIVRSCSRYSGVLVLILGLSVLAGCATPNAAGESPSPAEAAKGMERPRPTLNLNSRMSIVHVGGNDTFAITPDGRQAGRLFFEALTKNDKASARQAIAVWQQIIPRENYGGEYSSLQWFAEYFVADQAEREKMIADPLVAEFFHLFWDKKQAVLKEYLKRKYHVQDIGDEEMYAGQTRKAWLEDVILFNNPRREEWEHTSRFMELIDMKPGQTVADIGAGPGYYTFRFAKKVGPTGKVYAIDTVQDHIKYVQKTGGRTGIANVEGIHTDGRTLGLGKRKVDRVFMCSLYHNIYAMSTEPERTELLNSIIAALNDDGILYLLDNGLVPPGTLPYHGPYIAKELVIAQLAAYGFELVADEQPIAQRFLLGFKKNPATAPATHHE